jgi:hypothetical protein
MQAIIAVFIIDDLFKINLLKKKRPKVGKYLGIAP